MSNKKKIRTPLVISENVECLAIAIAMALLLKFFIIEAYKIPSGSMQPTIFGNKDVGLFDRVLVNKSIYLVEKPKRWDVIVFKFPLNQSQNYIKRLIGLPGEKVTIKNGDIYINDRIARKTENATNSVLKKVYPSGKKGENIDEAFTIEGRSGNDALAADNLVLQPGGKATMGSIRAKYFHGYDPGYGIPFPAAIRPDEHQYVGDLRVSFEVQLDSEAGGVRGEIEENQRMHTFFLKAAGREGPSYIETRSTKTSEPGTAQRVWFSNDVALEAGRSTEVAFANIDDRLSIRLDGEEVASHPYDTDAVERSNDVPNAVSFGPVDAGGAFSEITVCRDIYYLHDSPLTGYTDFIVPEEHYFALGDNTQNSSDGRRWKMATLNLKDGRAISGEYVRGKFPTDLNQPRSTKFCTFIDLFGDGHTLCGQDLNGYPEIKSESFFHEKFLLGKAMAVFWPIYPHFRWKLIR